VCHASRSTTWYLNLVGAVVHLLACDGFCCVVLAATMNVRGVFLAGFLYGLVHLLASEEHRDTDVRSHDARDKFSFLMFYLASGHSITWCPLLLERLGVEGYGSQTFPISFGMVLGTHPDVGAELQFVSCFCAIVRHVGTVSSRPQSGRHDAWTGFTK